MQLPIFPAGVSEINSRIAVEAKDGQVCYVYGHLPVLRQNCSTDTYHSLGTTISTLWYIKITGRLPIVDAIEAGITDPKDLASCATTGSRPPSRPLKRASLAITVPNTFLR